MTVRTYDELDALPDKTVVLSRPLNHAVQILRDAYPDPKWWHFLIDCSTDVVVLWRPDWGDTRPHHDAQCQHLHDQLDEQANPPFLPNLED